MEQGVSAPQVGWMEGGRGRRAERGVGGGGGVKVELQKCKLQFRILRLELHREEEANHESARFHFRLHFRLALSPSCGVQTPRWQAWLHSGGRRADRFLRAFLHTSSIHPLGFWGFLFFFWRKGPSRRP